MTTGDNDRMNHEKESSEDGASVDFLLEWEEAELPQQIDRLEPTREASSYLTGISEEEPPDGQSQFPTDLQYEKRTSWRRTELSDKPEALHSAGPPPLPLSQPPWQKEPVAPGLTPSRDVESPAFPGPASATAPAGATSTQQPVSIPQAVNQTAAVTAAIPHEASSASEKTSTMLKGEEFFQWTAERNKAIEEALSETSEARLPTVHSQLDSIRRSLAKGEITRERALELLREIETYLGDKIDHQKNKVTVAHEAVIGARSDLLKGLYSYQESVNSLKEFLASGEDVQLHLSVYTADQATSFIAQARHTIMEAKPELPEESAAQ